MRPPQTRLVFTPREYQKLIKAHILNVPRNAVFAGMGLGKTVSVLTALDDLFFLGEETKPALVIAPLRVAQSTWPDEARKWGHFSNIEVSAIVGDDAQRRRAMRRSASVYTINYENVPWLLDQLEGRWPFGMLVADESTRLKGFRSRQGTMRARRLGEIAHKHPTRWVNLTGTPSPNGLKDLWGQTWFIDAGERLGRTYESFKQRWFRPGWGDSRFEIEPLPTAQQEISDRIKDICVSLDAKDYFPIEEPIRRTIHVDLPAGARNLYRNMERQLFLEIDGWEVEAFNSASKTLKLLQLASGAIYVGEEKKADREWKEVHDAKLQALDSIVEEAAGQPILVAYHFKSDLARLQKAFPKARTLDAKPETIREWNAGHIPMLLAHPASAGHGLNLQDGGNIIVHFSHWWDLELFQQINERLGPTRQKQAGHNRAVFEYYIVARDTMDEDVMERREGKKSVQEVLMSALKRRGGKL